MWEAWSNQEGILEEGGTKWALKDKKDLDEKAKGFRPSWPTLFVLCLLLGAPPSPLALKPQRLAQGQYTTKAPEPQGGPEKVELGRWCRREKSEG